MAFVADSIIDRWFDPAENSWVYRGFCWLYQNPLWNKKIPVGFSLCPYFWLSVFSWVIFRPLVYAVFMPVLGITKLLAFVIGTPYGKLDIFVNKKAFSDELSDHIAIPMAFLFLLLAVILFAALGVLALSWWNIEDAFLKTLIAISVASLVSMFGSLIYQGTHYTDCKPVVYSFIFTLLSCGVMGFVFPEVAENLATSGAVIWNVIVAFFALIWLALGGIAFGFVWLVSAFLAGVSVIFSAIFSPEVLLVVVTWVVIAGIIGWISLMGLKHTEKTYAKRETDEEYIARVNAVPVTNDDWKWLIYRSILKYTDTVDDLALLNEREMEDALGFENIEENYLKKTIARVIESMIYDSVFSYDLPKSFLNISRIEFKQWEKALETNGMRWPDDEHCEGFLSARTSIRRDVGGCFFSEEHLRGRVKAFIERDEKLKIQIEKMAKKGERLKKREAKCAHVTSYVMNLMVIIGRVIAYPFVKVEQSLWFVLKEFGRLMVYLWIVAKDKKKGACPFRYFEHVERTPSPQAKLEDIKNKSGSNI